MLWQEKICLFIASKISLDMCFIFQFLSDSVQLKIELSFICSGGAAFLINQLCDRWGISQIMLI